jgi:hypothetical protein
VGQKSGAQQEEAKTFLAVWINGKAGDGCLQMTDQSKNVD